MLSLGTLRFWPEGKAQRYVDRARLFIQNTSRSRWSQGRDLLSTTSGSWSMGHRLGVCFGTTPPARFLPLCKVCFPRQSLSVSLSLAFCLEHVAKCRRELLYQVHEGPVVLRSQGYFKTRDLVRLMPGGVGESILCGSAVWGSSSIHQWGLRPVM